VKRPRVPSENLAKHGGLCWRGCELNGKGSKIALKVEFLFAGGDEAVLGKGRNKKGRAVRISYFDQLNP